MSTLNTKRRRKPRYHHGDLRNALIEQAVKQVEEAGAESFSLRETARLVGVSANAAYRHFADKSDLLAAVAEVGLTLQEQYIQRTIAVVTARPTAAATAVERLKAAGRAYVEFVVDHPELQRVMFEAGRRPTIDQGAPRTPRATPSPPYLLLGQVLDELVTAGALPAERRPGAELKAWTVVHGFASLVIQGMGAVQQPESRTKALEAVLDFAVIGLCGQLPP